MKSDYLQSAVLGWRKGTAMPAAPATLYVGLFNGSPTDTGTGGTEVTTTIRTAGRPTAAFGSVTVNTGGANTMSNPAIVDFGIAAADATWTHFGLFDAASAGNLLDYGAFTGTQTITTGTGLTFPIGQLTVTEA